MSGYKTILVHLNDPARVERLAGVAAALGAGSKAHVVGLYVVPPAAIVGAGPGAAGGLRVFDQVRKQMLSMAPSVRATFETAVAKVGLGAEWRQADAANTTVPIAVLAAARTADLVVASETAPNWAYSRDLECSTLLATDSGRPTLIVPLHGSVVPLGLRVLVAWDGSREATRAIHDALPLLRAAGHTRLLTVQSERATESGQTETDDDIGIAANLKRHGVSCETRRVKGSEARAGAMILSEARAFGADLLVTGCYGRSRMREFLLGGATRHVLDHLHLPVLMSH